MASAGAQSIGFVDLSRISRAQYESSSLAALATQLTADGGAPFTAFKGASWELDQYGGAASKFRETVTLGYRTSAAFDRAVSQFTQNWKAQKVSHDKTMFSLPTDQNSYVRSRITALTDSGTATISLAGQDGRLSAGPPLGANPVVKLFLPYVMKAQTFSLSLGAAACDISAGSTLVAGRVVPVITQKQIAAAGPLGKINGLLVLPSSSTPSAGTVAVLAFARGNSAQSAADRVKLVNLLRPDSPVTASLRSSRDLSAEIDLVGTSPRDFVSNRPRFGLAKC